MPDWQGAQKPEIGSATELPEHPHMAMEEDPTGEVEPVGHGLHATAFAEA